MSEPKDVRPEPEKERAYEPPAILWEDELPQGAGLFAACQKFPGNSDDCNAYPHS